MDNAPTVLIGLSADPTTAPVGINPRCGVPKANKDGSLGNVVNMHACGLSMIVVATLAIRTTRRKVAVGAFFFTLRGWRPLERSTDPLPQVDRSSGFS